MKILITGHEGFIGSYFVNNLSETYFDVDGVSLSNTKTLNLSSYNVIIHTSGIAHQKKNTPYSLYEKINVNQTYSLALKAKNSGISHFIFLSSIKVYGDKLFNFSENHVCEPIDNYGKSKKLAEDKLLELVDDQFRITILRLPLVYGPSPKGNIKLLLKLIHYCPIIPLGKISNKRTIISISNLTEYIKQIISNNITGIIVPSDLQSISTSRLIFLLAKAQRKKVFLVRMPLFFQKSIEVIIPGIFIRLFRDYYVQNENTLKLFDLSKMNESQSDIQLFYGQKGK